LPLERLMIRTGSGLNGTFGFGPSGLGSRFRRTWPHSLKDLLAQRRRSLPKSTRTLLPNRYAHNSCARRFALRRALIPLAESGSGSTIAHAGDCFRGRRTSPFGKRDRPQRVGSTSPAGPDAAVQPRWSLSRRMPPRATAITGFGSPRRWRRTSSSEVERPLAKKRCGGLLSAAAATPQRSSSDSSQSDPVVRPVRSTVSRWPVCDVRDVPRSAISAAGFFYLTDARRLEGDRSARRAALRDACRRMRFLRCCALLMDMLRLQQRAEALRQLSALIRQHSFSHTVPRHPGEHRYEERPGKRRRLGQVGHGGTSPRILP